MSRSSLERPFKFNISIITLTSSRNWSCCFLYWKITRLVLKIFLNNLFTNEQLAHVFRILLIMHNFVVFMPGRVLPVHCQSIPWYIGHWWKVCSPESSARSETKRAWNRNLRKQRIRYDHQQLRIHQNQRFVWHDSPNNKQWLWPR